MPMSFRTILCPTDLTPAGDAAIRLAYAVAAKDATVHVLHVVEPGVVSSPFDGTPIMLTATSPAVLESLRTKAAHHLKQLVDEGALTRGVRSETHVVHGVDAAAVIQREAERLGADVIVAGTHGRKGMSDLLLGSVARQLLKQARLPVVLVRGGRG